MDAQQFLAEFGHIANAPNGIARLRELILALAVQGRLVRQIETTEPAAVQVERIRRIADERPVTGRRKKTNALEASSFLPATEHALPMGWANVPLCHLVRVLNGRAYSKLELLESGTPVLRVGNLFTSDKWYYSNLELEDDKYCDEEDLLYAWSASFGPFIWRGEKVIYHYHIWKLDLFSSAELNKNYLYTYLLEKTQEIKAAGHGISMAHMTKEKFEQLSVLLPPLEEQSRIVAKVDELMALCDKMEAQQQARRKLQNNLRLSTLQAVASATSPHELQTSWMRLADNFGQLFHAPEDVIELRKLILDMAMRGYLVEQDAMEEPATVLCAHIEDKKRELSKTRKLKLQKSPSQIGEDEIPFDVPAGWTWIRLGQIAELINGDRGKNYPNKDEYVSVGVPWINTGHIKPDGTLTRHHMNFISREKFDSLNSGKIEANDLVYCLRGATFGKTAFVTPYEEGAIASSLMIIRPIISNLSRFLYYYLISPLGRSQIFRFDNGTAQPNLSANSVGLFSYPLPPLQEQIRIVDKIEQLMRVCDSIELQLRQSTEISGRLAVASVAALTGIAIEQEEEPMKAPQTEKEVVE